MISIDTVKKSQPLLYRKIDLDLTNMRVDEEYDIAGQFMYFFVDGVRTSPYQFSGGLSIKFNSRTADQIYIRNLQYYKIPFASFFISNDACGTGYLGFCFKPMLHIIVGMSADDFETGFWGEELPPLMADSLSGSTREYTNSVSNGTVLMLQVPNNCYAVLTFFCLSPVCTTAGTAILFHTTSGDVLISYVARYSVLSANQTFALCGNPNLLLFPGDKLKISSDTVGMATNSNIILLCVPNIS